MKQVTQGLQTNLALQPELVWASVSLFVKWKLHCCAGQISFISTNICLHFVSGTSHVPPPTSYILIQLIFGFLRSEPLEHQL